MSSYTDRFGTGAMPTFNIGQGQGNTSWKYGGDESAAMMQDHLDQRAREYAEQKEFFQDTTMPALKAMFNPDEPEKDPLDSLLEATAGQPDEIPPLGDPDRGSNPDIDQSQAGIYIDDEGNERVMGDEFGKGSWVKDVGAAGTMLDLLFSGGLYTAADLVKNTLKPMTDKEIDDFYKDPDVDYTGDGVIDAQDQAYSGYGFDKHRNEFDLQAGDTNIHGNEVVMDSPMYDADSPMNDPNFWENYNKDNKANGGRIGMNTGGYLPWTQTMTSDYANQYYNQFNNPTFGATTATQATTPTQSDTPTDLGDLGTIVPTTVPLSGGLAQQRGSGPEDRGTWEQRFSPEHQYNRPGVHQGIAYESDDDGVLRVSHVPNSLENVFSLEDEAHPFLQGVYDVGQLVPRTTSFLAGLLGFGKDKDDKEAKAVEQAALQKELQQQRAIEDQIEQNRIASALAAQQELAAINSGGDGSDNDNTTQTSTSTGSGGSPSAGGVSLGTSLHGGNQYSGGGGGGWRDRDRTGDNRIGCFVKGTMIQMADGTEKEITTIEVGEETKGGQVQAKMEFLPERIYDYKGVKVSGSHWVIEDNQFIEVENSKHGVLTDRLETVYCFKTSDNRIWIKDIEFGDFETGSDADWEPHFEMVKQKLNKELREKRL